MQEAETAERAYEMLHESEWSLVFCDVMLGGENGFAVLRRFTKEQPQARVILMTGYGSAAGALDATAFGAYDYLLKPFTVANVQAIANKMSEHLSGPRAYQHGEREEKAAPVYLSDIDLVGRSPAFVEVMKLVGKVALTNLLVLIAGESGTGKEVIARAILRAGLNETFESLW